MNLNNAPNNGQEKSFDLDDTENIRYFLFCFYFQDDTVYNYLQKPNHMDHVCDLHKYDPKLSLVNTLRPKQNGRQFPDDIFKRIFLNQTVRIPINISLEFIHKGPSNNIPALVQIMAWRRPGNKPLSETMLVSLLTHICVTRPQWVNEGQNIAHTHNALRTFCC